MNGAVEEFSEEDKKWFLKVREAVGEDEIVDYPPGYTAKDLGQFLDKWKGLLTTAEINPKDKY